MVIGAYGTNCYIVYREGGKEAIVIDPADRGEQIYETLAGKGYTVSAIFVTHGHFDHIWGVEALKELYPDSLCSLQYEKDYELLFAVRLSAQCTDERVNKVTPRPVCPLHHPGELCPGGY